jgi:hypothetical protein
MAGTFDSAWKHTHSLMQVRGESREPGVESSVIVSDGFPVVEVPVSEVFVLKVPLDGASVVVQRASRGGRDRRPPGGAAAYNCVGPGR